MLPDAINRHIFAVVPRQDAFRGVAAADEPDLSFGLFPAQFARNVKEEPAFGNLHAVAIAGLAQHGDALIQGRAMKFLVRINPRDDAHHFPDLSARRVNQREMGTGHRIERPSQNADPLHRKVLRRVPAE
jgi:hypothetical protein